MGYNLAVFAWKPELTSAAKRKKAGVTFDDVFRAICESGTHEAIAAHDFAPFEQAIVDALGDGDDAPYTIERHERARVLRLAYDDETKLVPIIGSLARRFGLTSAGER